MTGKNVAWLVVYYIVVLIFAWYVMQDRPVKVLYWHYLNRASWRLAKAASKLSIHAEENYRLEVERSR